MREIIFRGKSKLEGVWMIGSLVNDKDRKWIYTQDEHWNMGVFVEVFPESIGQYTGLKDVNGVEIYEGDIVKNIGPHSPTIRKYGFGEFRYIDENLVVCKELVGITLRHVVDFKFQIESPNGLNGMSPNGWYGPKPPIDNEQFWNYQRSFEVIGNIFENPETLEVSNNV